MPSWTSAAHLPWHQIFEHRALAISMETAIMIAYRKEDLMIVTGLKALLMAARFGLLDLVESLIKASFVSFVTFRKFTALSWYPVRPGERSCRVSPKPRAGWFSEQNQEDPNGD
ncbi:hypothetical protein ACJ73_07580 [Blastomyces percursus]|uniref:Uncharacterized protein n=1 Tax=Blastomyces percursus TaxID=1658174 RepID=A0A1J9PXL0_9EURO|nr:hypothetical protein ACJ73_07580 [Blastomyces percursus]